MDEIVAQSLKKWPNVPHCYGWLALDARGHWRMRDQHAQDHDLPGDKIAHTALIGFINRNYACDAKGRWYFQNGPQRVYINLEMTPYIARTDPAHGFLLHTGAPLEHIDAVWFSDADRLLLTFDGGASSAAATVAALDDRDLAACLPAFRIDGQPVDDGQLMDWIEGGRVELTLLHRDRMIPVQRIAQTEIAQHFDFVLRPQADDAP